ncbi:hypothetical protein PVK06_004972 [Gossypium arboreum]|uniref:Uncharacterized protein n=1 Tax=Gossypium arboreum TaxID=29729 RepID=A0ABR0QTH1_GOSAR|nr:hypothetical protein PVK06_004972 [Gossypium arboreum]
MLQDVTLIPGVPIDGFTISKEMSMTMDLVCGSLLGATPLDSKKLGTFVLHTWFDGFPKVLLEESLDLDVQYANQTLIMKLIGTTSIPDKFSN